MRRCRRPVPSRRRRPPWLRDLVAAERHHFDDAIARDSGRGERRPHIDAERVRHQPSGPSFTSLTRRTRQTSNLAEGLPTVCRAILWVLVVTIYPQPSGDPRGERPARLFNLSGKGTDEVDHDVAAISAPPDPNLAARVNPRRRRDWRRRHPVRTVDLELPGKVMSAAEARHEALRLSLGDREIEHRGLHRTGDAKGDGARSSSAASLSPPVRLS